MMILCLRLLFARDDDEHTTTYLADPAHVREPKRPEPHFGPVLVAQHERPPFVTVGPAVQEFTDLAQFKELAIIADFDAVAEPKIQRNLGVDVRLGGEVALLLDLPGGGHRERDVGLLVEDSVLQDTQNKCEMWFNLLT